MNLVTQLLIGFLAGYGLGTLIIDAIRVVVYFNRSSDN